MKRITDTSQVTTTHQPGHHHSPTRSPPPTDQVTTTHRPGHHHSPTRSPPLTDQVTTTHRPGHHHSPTRSPPLTDQVTTTHRPGHHHPPTTSPPLTVCSCCWHLMSRSEISLSFSSSASWSFFLSSPSRDPNSLVNCNHNNV